MFLKAVIPSLTSHLLLKGSSLLGPCWPPWSCTFKQGVPCFPLGSDKHPCKDQASLPYPSSVCPSPCSAPPLPLVIRMPKWQQSRFNWDCFFCVRYNAHNLVVLPEWETWRSQGILRPWCYLGCGNLLCIWRSRLGVWGISSLKQLDTTWQLLVTVHVICGNPRVKWKQIEKANTVIISAGKVLDPGDMAWQTGSLENTGGSTSARVIFLFT